jgi:hypothetical protein
MMCDIGDGMSRRVFAGPAIAAALKRALPIYVRTSMARLPQQRSGSSRRHDRTGGM